MQRAVDAGANTFQIFQFEPADVEGSPVKPEEAKKMREARAKHDVNPIVIHASYLINLCSQTESVRENSVECVSRRGGARAGAGARSTWCCIRGVEGTDARGGSAAGGAGD